MLRLLLINVSQNWGSTGKISEQIGRIARDEGWSVYMAHGSRYVNPSQLNDILVSNRGEEYVHYGKSLLFDAQGLGSKGATRRLCNKLDEIKPDIIHLHIMHGCYINYEILFQYVHNHHIPIVWTLHDCWAFTGHCVHFGESQCMKWQTHCCQCPSKHTFPKSLLLDRSFRNFEKKRAAFLSADNMTIVPVSKWLGSLVEQSFLGKYPVHVISNGVDLDIFKFVKSDLKGRLGLNNKFMLLGVAQEFGKRKGLLDFCRLSRNLDDNFQIVLVGLSDKEKRQIEGANIMGFGQTNGVEELVEFYSSADVLLSLSYEETFGLTIAEGMACGTPAVIYDNTGQSEIVNEDTGIKVNTGDVEGVKKAIINVCTKGRSYYSQTCRDRVARLFNKDERFADYIKLYKKLLVEM